MPENNGLRKPQPTGSGVLAGNTHATHDGPYIHDSSYAKADGLRELNLGDTVSDAVHESNINSAIMNALSYTVRKLVEKEKHEVGKLIKDALQVVRACSKVQCPCLLPRGGPEKKESLKYNDSLQWR